MSSKEIPSSGFCSHLVQLRDSFLASVTNQYNKGAKWCTVEKVTIISGGFFGASFVTIVVVVSIQNNPGFASAFYATSSVVAVLSLIVFALSIVKQHCPGALTFHTNDSRLQEDIANLGEKIGEASEQLGDAAALFVQKATETPLSPAKETGS